MWTERTETGIFLVLQMILLKYREYLKELCACVLSFWTRLVMVPVVTRQQTWNKTSSRTEVSLKCLVSLHVVSETEKMYHLLWLYEIILWINSMYNKITEKEVTGHTFDEGTNISIYLAIPYSHLYVAI